VELMNSPWCAKPPRRAELSQFAGSATLAAAGTPVLPGWPDDQAG
jgi:hypothetical protein